MKLAKILMTTTVLGAAAALSATASAQKLGGNDAVVAKASEASIGNYLGRPAARRLREAFSTA